MSGCLEGAEIARFVDGDFTLGEREALDVHRATCARCRAAVDEMRGVVADLARAPAPPVMDLGPLVLARAALPRPRRRMWRGGVALVAAASFGLVAGVALSRHQGQSGSGVDEAGFQRRGGGDSPDAWVDIHPYAISAKLDGGRPRRLTTNDLHEKSGRTLRIGCDDRLLFAYDNGGPRPYSHLMIFSVDEAGRFEWFFPEKKAGAVSTVAGAGFGRELHEEVPLESATGARRLYGLFSRGPLSVEEVERATLRAPTRGMQSPEGDRGRLPLPDTGQQRLDFAACDPGGQK